MEWPKIFLWIANVIAQAAITTQVQKIKFSSIRKWTKKMDKKALDTIIWFMAKGVTWAFTVLALLLALFRWKQMDYNTFLFLDGMVMLGQQIAILLIIRLLLDHYLKCMSYLCNKPYKLIIQRYLD